MVVQRGRIVAQHSYAGQAAAGSIGFEGAPDILQSLLQDVRWHAEAQAEVVRLLKELPGDDAGIILVLQDGTQLSPVQTRRYPRKPDDSPGRLAPTQFFSSRKKPCTKARLDSIKDRFLARRESSWPKTWVEI